MTAGWIAGTALGLAAALAAPDDVADPYTEGEPERVARAGYAALGAFEWSGGAPTSRVEAILGVGPLRWIETEHFRIGSALPAYDVPNADEESVRAELKALRERLPGLSSRREDLDPWLRAHLFAARLEAHYDQVCALLGVSDQDVAAERGPRGEQADMGSGPYLGMRHKYDVLLLETQASLARYGEAFLHVRGLEGAYRSVHPDGGLVFVTAVEVVPGLERDRALHAHVAFHVTGMLLDGYRSFRHEAPLWWAEGIAQRLARPIATDPVCSTMPMRRAGTADGEDWASRLRRRVRNGFTPSISEMFTWEPTRACSEAELMAMWSRVDYLIARDEEAFAHLAFLLKDPSPHARMQDEALLEAYGLTPPEFDEAWALWVRRTYPR